MSTNANSICLQGRLNSCGLVRMEGDIPFLPNDITVNILKRLSVKSLIQLQCVCKHWKNLIRTPYFIAEHLHYSSHKKPLLLLGRRPSISSGFHWVSLDCDMREHVVQSSPLFNSLPFLHIYGSSNGLLCLQCFPPTTNPILLGNLSTGDIIQVPRTINVFEDPCYIGFGFSPTVNDYKIVVIYRQHFGKVYRVHRDGACRAEVYSLGTESWKEVELGNLEGFNVRYDTVSANGDVFWVGSRAVHGKDEINWSVISFDIAKEVFTVIPIPAAPLGSLIRKLTVYENNVAMLCVKWNAKDDFCIKLWVMEEGSSAFGERWSFTNKSTGSFPSDLALLYPVTIWRNEIICESISDFDYEDQDEGPTTGLYLFNLSNNEEFRTCAIQDHDFSYRMLVHNYVESLVPINNFHVENP